MTSPLSGGLLWKIPWRLSKFQKRRHRERLRAVDDVIATVDAALTKKGETIAALEQWKSEMPTEAEMLPRDKYTMFDRKEKKYRKGIHSKSTHGPRRRVGRVAFRHCLGEICEALRDQLMADLSLELPKWTRVSQRLNPPGY